MLSASAASGWRAGTRRHRRWLGRQARSCRPGIGETVAGVGLRCDCGCAFASLEALILAGEALCDRQDLFGASVQIAGQFFLEFFAGDLWFVLVEVAIDEQGCGGQGLFTSSESKNDASCGFAIGPKFQPRVRSPRRKVSGKPMSSGMAPNSLIVIGQGIEGATICRLSALKFGRSAIYVDEAQADAFNGFDFQQVEDVEGEFGG